MFPPDLEERFRRVYAAIGEAYMNEPEKFVRVVDVPGERGVQVARILFDGGQSQEQLKNDALTAVASVANLKDHLLRFAKTSGRDSRDVHETIKASCELAVLADLHDAEKHGESRGPGRRSGLRPRLGSVSRALRPDGTGPMSFSITIEPGTKTFANPKALGASSVIVADVVDEEGKKIGSGDLVGMIEAGLAAYERMLGAWGVILPPRQ